MRVAQAIAAIAARTTKLYDRHGGRHFLTKARKSRFETVFDLAFELWHISRQLRKPGEIRHGENTAKKRKPAIVSKVNGPVIRSRSQCRSSWRRQSPSGCVLDFSSAGHGKYQNRTEPATAAISLGLIRRNAT